MTAVSIIALVMFYAVAVLGLTVLLFFIMVRFLSWIVSFCLKPADVGLTSKPKLMKTNTPPVVPVHVSFPTASVKRPRFKVGDRVKSSISNAFLQRNQEYIVSGIYRPQGKTWYRIWIKRIDGTSVPNTFSEDMFELSDQDENCVGKIIVGGDRIKLLTGIPELNLMSGAIFSARKFSPGTASTVTIKISVFGQEVEIDKSKVQLLPWFQTETKFSKPAKKFNFNKRPEPEKPYCPSRPPTVPKTHSDEVA